MRAFLSDAKSYITSLKESKGGKSMFESNRKTGFLGFCVCIDSILTMYNNLVDSPQFGLEFLCLFKVSQDHLELFFAKIRRLGGCNNNPSARHFIAAYRKLVVHSDLQDVLRGNCLPLKCVPILTASSHFISNIDIDESPSVTALNTSVARSRIINPDDSALVDPDYTFIPNSALLSSCSEKIVAYIAGFVVFKLKNTLHCDKCIEALNEKNESNLCSLIKLKSKGGLIFPSEDVIDVCLTCEKFFRQNVSRSDMSLSKVTCHALTQSVLQTYVNKECFLSLSEHMLECSPTENHIVLLIKAITEKYMQVRYYYAGKPYTAKLHEKKQKISRHVNTKLIIFSGQ